MDIELYYNNYINNWKDIWLNRFTFKGLDGRQIFASSNLAKFLKLQNNNYIFNNALDYREWAKKTAKDYTKWFYTINTSEKQADDYDAKLYNFCIGVLGEFFYITLLSSQKRIVIKKSIITIDYITPLYDIPDRGVDFVCKISFNGNTRTSVGQIKFWNPYNKSAIFDSKSLMGAIGQGYLEDILQQTEGHEKECLLCWLGEEKSISSYIKDYPKGNKALIGIDKKILADQFDNFNANLFYNNILSATFNKLLI